ncbi:MAG: hypothetical protein RR297_07165, partial [Clostridia bacterium]
MGRNDTRTLQQRRADRKRPYEIMQQAGLQCNSVENVQPRKALILKKSGVYRLLENAAITPTR